MGPAGAPSPLLPQPPRRALHLLPPHGSVSSFTALDAGCAQVTVTSHPTADLLVPHSLSRTLLLSTPTEQPHHTMLAVTAENTHRAEAPSPGGSLAFRSKPKSYTWL